MKKDPFPGTHFLNLVLPTRTYAGMKSVNVL